MIIWISGPTGSGKTSLCKLLSNVGYKIIGETLPPEIFAKFRVNPTEHCAELQFEIMRSRVQQWNEFQNNDKIAFDRSVSEDYDVFCRLHFENQLLSQNEHELLESYCRNTEQIMPRPDLIIYMSATLETLKSRLLSNNHPGEIIAGLHRQIELYSDWIQNQKESVIKIDNSQCEIPILKKMFNGG